MPCVGIFAKEPTNRSIQLVEGWGTSRGPSGCRSACIFYDLFRDVAAQAADRVLRAVHDIHRDRGPEPAMPNFDVVNCADVDDEGAGAPTIEVQRAIGERQSGEAARKEPEEP